MISRRLLYAVFFICILCALLLSGGLWVLRFVERTPTAYLRDQVILSVLMTVLSLAIGSVLYRKDRDFFSKKLAVFAGIFFLCVYGSEAAACLVIPPWPAIGLHGVSKEAGSQAWGRVEQLKKGVGFNSWGQRDLERTKKPAKDRLRIAFVGDSLLEESSAVPVSVRVEQLVGDPKIEILNLGVSATDPEEYYYRIKNIAIPLGTRHVMMFFYEGNDLISEGSLTSYYGIAAVYPRDSFLWMIGLRAWNHLLTNHRRPVIKAWGRSGDLNRSENILWKFIRTHSLKEFYVCLSGWSSQSKRGVFLKYLFTRNLAPFFDVVKNPDEGLFRSYYLEKAVQYIVNEAMRTGELDETVAYELVKRSFLLCRKKGIGFTLVVVPEAFQVDARMRAQWMPLMDMRNLRARQHRAVGRMATRASGDGIRVLNLQNYLQRIPGAYLNLDGHWSSRGVEAVSVLLSSYIEEFLVKKA